MSFGLTNAVKDVKGNKYILTGPEEKRMGMLLRGVVNWMLQDSTDLSEARRKLEEIGFEESELESFGFPEIVGNGPEESDGTPGPDISRMLTISLDYASYDLLEDLQNNGVTNKLGGVTVYNYDFGYVIHTKSCQTEEEWECWLSGIDRRLHRLLRFAHEHRCNVLRLDDDGPVLDELEVIE